MVRNDSPPSEGAPWFGFLTPKVDMPTLVTTIICTPTIQRFCGEMCIT